MHHLLYEQILTLSSAAFYVAKTRVLTHEEGVLAGNPNICRCIDILQNYKILTKTNEATKLN